MDRSSPDFRFRNGQCEYRVYAYVHKEEPTRLGVLEARDYEDARRHLGSGFRIKTIWLTNSELVNQMLDWGEKRKIVARAFGSGVDLLIELAMRKT